MRASHLVMAGALAGLACTRLQSRTETAATPEAPRAPVVSRVSREARDARVEQALARSPLLNRAAAELLVENAESRGGIWGDPVDASLIEANRGFSRLSPAELSELGALFGEAYGSLSAADRAAVEAYVERVRRGDASDGDERARVLLTQAVKALAEARRVRLQALVESALRGAVESERRTALSARETPLPPAPATRPPAWASREAQGGAYHRPVQRAEDPPSDHESEDARLRALGQAYKAELDRLEEDVRYAERNVQSAQRSVAQARETPLNLRPLGDPDVTAAEQRLADAREGLQRARNALDDLHTRIRRERIPMSYVQ
jgi:hypothetical protein